MTSPVIEAEMAGRQLDSAAVSEIIKSLAATPNIGKITFKECEIDPTNAQALFGHLKTLPQIKTISLISFPMDEESFAVTCQAIGQAKDLEALVVQGGQLTESQTKQLSTALQTQKVLRSLTYAGNPIGCLAEGIKALSDLVVLDLTGCPLHGEGMKSVANAISASQTVKILVLQKTGLEGTDGVVIGDLLKSNALEGLVLDDNFLQKAESVSVVGEALEPIAASLKGHSHLKKLSMNNCGISPMGMKRLAQMIAPSSQDASVLEVLDLSNNRFYRAGRKDGESHGVSNLTAILSNIPSLKELAIAGCSIKAKGVIAIAEGIENFLGSELCLSMGCNKVTQEGFDRLKDALETLGWGVHAKVAFPDCSFIATALEKTAVDVEQKKEDFIRGGVPRSEVEEVLASAPKAKALTDIEIALDHLERMARIYFPEDIDKLGKRSGCLSLDSLKLRQVELQKICEVPLLMLECQARHLLDEHTTGGIHLCLENKVFSEKEMGQVADLLTRCTEGKEVGQSAAAIMELLSQKKEFQEKYRIPMLLMDCQKAGVLEETVIEGLQISIVAEYFTDDESAELAQLLSKCLKGQNVEESSECIMELLAYVIQPAMLASLCRDQGLLSPKEEEVVEQALLQLSKLSSEDRQTLINSLSAKLEEASGS